MSSIASSSRYSRSNPPERRRHRRHDFEHRELVVERFETDTSTRALGRIVDLSAGGVRIRCSDASVAPQQQIRVRLELPTYAGICPFVTRDAQGLRPNRQWTGWIDVTRVRPIDDEEVEVAGRLLDMDEIDRGMLSLYLSTQPLAA